MSILNVGAKSGGHKLLFRLFYAKIIRLIMRKKIASFIGLGLFILVVTSLLMWRGAFLGLQKGLQNQFYDYDSASRDIVVVAIDEKSLSSDGLGPLNQWQRAYYAQVIQNVLSAGAQAIGIDITLPDPSFYGSDDDRILAQTLRENTNVVLAARTFYQDGQKAAELPNATLLSAHPTLGWINVGLDFDGFVRTLPIFSDYKGATYEAFALQVARKYLEAPATDFSLSRGQYAFSQAVNIPAWLEHDAQNGTTVPMMYINYFTEPNRYTRISFADAYKGVFVDRQGKRVDLKNKVVLVGPTAADLQDTYLSPVSDGVKMPGVEIHANALQTILSGKYLRDQSTKSLWITLIAVTVLNLLIFSFIKIRYGVPLFVLEFIGFLVAGIVAYESLIFLNVVYPIWVSLMSFVGAYLLRYFLEQKERRFIENAFGHYVHPDVVRQIVKDPRLLELGGQKKELTVFFSDLADFTSISESMDPADLVTLLNKYLEAMTEVILDQRGTLDKYVGDAIMAFWGAPTETDSPAIRACRSALRCQKKLDEMKFPTHARIGLNTGPAVVGNVGSSQRFDYTAIGDNVNLASRLEGANKVYGTRILASETTYLAAREAFLFREIDRIRVKGKHKPVSIYELIAEQSQATDEQKNQADVFAKALDLYRTKKFAEAEKLFTSLRDDAAADVYIKRCQEYQKVPPAADWDGVTTMTHK